MLKSIRISNFKGILDRPVELGKFNVLIGANAAGKTNFVDALRFIHDILEEGVSSAVGRRLGWENVLTRDKSKLERITAEIQCCLPEMGGDIKLEGKTYRPVNLEYMFRVACSMKRFYLDSERLKFDFQRNGSEITESFGRSRQKVKVVDSIFFRGPAQTFTGAKQTQDRLFLEAGFLSLGSSILSDLIRRWRFYELDVSDARSSCADVSGDVLLGNGGNLASILDKLKETEALRVVRAHILETMSTLIPGFRDWKTERQFDGSIGFKIREYGISKGLWPKMLSDGTIRLLSVLVALVYGSSEASLICVDEPERYLHPQVLEPLVEIMRDVSEKTQLIVTTQSAELVKYLRPSEVLMVDKKSNVTHIKRAEDVEMVNKFMEDFTMDELWLGGYLTGGRIL